MFQVHEPSIGANTLAPVTVRPLLMATKGFPLEGESEGPHCVPAGEMIKEFRGNNCSGILYLMSRSYQEKYSLFFFFSKVESFSIWFAVRIKVPALPSGKCSKHSSQQEVFSR